MITTICLVIGYVILFALAMIVINNTLDWTVEFNTGQTQCTSFLSWIKYEHIKSLYIFVGLFCVMVGSFIIALV